MLRTLIAIVVLLPGCAASAPSTSRIVRLASVNTPVYTGLLASLIPDFERQSGYRVSVHGGENAYAEARAGRADIVLSHFGRPELEPFVTEGFGLWPRTVFANQAALIGPGNDPANIRGLRDPVEAFRRIAKTRSAFVANKSKGAAYLTHILWEAAGRPDKDSWFLDSDRSRDRAVRLADEKKAYVIHGAFPFLRNRDKHHQNLEALVVDAPLLQRVMVTVVVDPRKVSGVNTVGARALERYLLSPSVQARIGRFRLPGFESQLWWPAGRHNDPAFSLVKLQSPSSPPPRPARSAHPRSLKRPSPRD